MSRLTDEETDRALEFKWIVDMILFERERAVLYREMYLDSCRKGMDARQAHTLASIAILNMECAFEVQDQQKGTSAQGQQANAN